MKKEIKEIKETRNCEFFIKNYDVEPITYQWKNCGLDPNLCLKFWILSS